jgi:uncharacterized protein (DUF58 family)
MSLGEHPWLRAGLALLAERFTPRGRALLAGLALACALRLGAIAEALNHVLALLGALLLSALVVGWLFRPRVALRRVVGAAPVAGQPFAYRVELRSEAARPLRDLWVEELGLPLGVRGTEGEAVDLLAPRSTQAVTLRLRFPRRGAWTLPGLQAASSFPAGLVKLGGRQRLPLRLVVHPAWTPLQGFVPPGRGGRGGGPPRGRSLGTGEDLAGLRPWRHGDRPRELCWRVFARRGQLVVPERPADHRPRRALVVDLHSPGRSGSAQREAVISTAAAAVHALSAHGLCLLVLGPCVHPLPTGVAAAAAALDLLALAEACPPLPPDPRGPDASGLIGAVFVLPGHAARRPAAVAAAEARGLATRTLSAGGGEA